MERDPADVIKRRESQALKLALITFVVVFPFGCFKLTRLQWEQEMNRPFDLKRWKELRRAFETTEKNEPELRRIAESLVHQDFLIGKSYEEAMNLLDLEPKKLSKSKALSEGYTVTLPRIEGFISFEMGTWLEVSFDKTGRVSKAVIYTD